MSSVSSTVGNGWHQRCWCANRYTSPFNINFILHILNYNALRYCLTCIHIESNHIQNNAFNTIFKIVGLDLGSDPVASRSRGCSRSGTNRKTEIVIISLSSHVRQKSIEKLCFVWCQPASGCIVVVVYLNIYIRHCFTRFVFKLLFLKEIFRSLKKQLVLLIIVHENTAHRPVKK